MSIIGIVYYSASKTGYEIWKTTLKIIFVFLIMFLEKIREDLK
jgi:hypothetical protein